MSAQPITEGIAAAPTRIELCGSLRADIGGHEIAALLPGRQGRTLFAFLVVNRHRAVARGELIEALWPDRLPEAPEAGLSTVLARVRRAVGDGVIEGRAELCLRLERGAHVDIELAGCAAETAERALAGGEPLAAIAVAEAALEIIARPLLPGVDGDWVRTCRDELAALEPGLLEVLARAALVAGGREQLATAERVARTLAERHPFRESGHALLIEIHGRRGNIAEATLAYERLRAFLRDELGTMPSAGVSALHETLLCTGALPGAAAAAAPPAGGAAEIPLPAIGGALPSTAFVGREDHLDRLRPPWLEAGMGQRRLALLVGEAGVGKTRLAGRFAAEVHAGGATVLYGRCDEEPLLSYQPFIETLRHYLRHGDWLADPERRRDLDELARVVPEARAEAQASAMPPSPQDPETMRYRLFEAIASLVGSATRRAPLLLVLDDLHWADKPTLLLLRHLLRHSDPARLMVLGMFRDVEVRDDHALVELIADLRRERRFDRIALGGLSESETEALVSARLSAPASAGFVRGLRAQTEGNAFFIEEALRSLLESQAVAAGEEASEQALESIGVPESVADVILRRLGRVSDLTAEALTVASVLGREFGMPALQSLLERSAEQVIEALEEAMEAGLIVEVAGAVDRFAFSHALARDAIYGRLSRTRGLRLHLRVATTLRDGDGDGDGGAGDASPGELAHHFYLARDVGGGESAVRYSILAAEEAARSLAYEESAEHYRRALEAIASDPGADRARRCDLLLALGRVQWQAGEAAARDTYGEAAACASERGAAQQLARAALGLAERYWEADDVDERYTHLVAEALDTLSTQDSTLRARLMGRMAENLHFTSQQQYGAQPSLEALEMARRLGDVDTLVTALMSRHVALLNVRHLDERLRLIDEVLSLTREHRALSVEALHWRLFDVFELGDLDAARRDHAELVTLARELRQPLLAHLAAGWEGAFAHNAGDVDGAERLARKSFQFARRAQVGTAHSYLAAMLFTLRRQQGRVAELLPAMESLARGGSAHRTWIAALALARIETGAIESGREGYERLVARDVAAVPLDWYWFMTVALLAETCVALRDADRAKRLHELLLPFADRYVQVIFSVGWGSVQRHLGMLAHVMERFDEAEEHFRAALSANKRVGAVLMTAQTQCEYGALLRRRGGGGDHARAAALGGLVEQVAVARGLDGLRRRAHTLIAAG